jgi:hypothetical protein
LLEYNLSLHNSLSLCLPVFLAYFFHGRQQLRHQKEPPKQLPLNEEEVVVLEAYLEQWNSTSGKERNVVWGM